MNEHERPEEQRKKEREANLTRRMESRGRRTEEGLYRVLLLSSFSEGGDSKRQQQKEKDRGRGEEEEEVEDKHIERHTLTENDRQKREDLVETGKKYIDMRDRQRRKDSKMDIAKDTNQTPTQSLRYQFSAKV